MSDQPKLIPQVEAEIDTWCEKTRELTGKVYWERQPWNTEVTSDAIKHFVYGTDDDNPLWSDPAYAAKTKWGRLQAPPAFLVSSLYPMLHGAPIKAPLASLIGGVEYEWSERIFVGDRLTPEPRQNEFYDKRNKDGRRLNFVISNVVYTNQHDKIVGRATATMIMATQVGTQVMLKHDVPKYSHEQIAEMEAIWRAEPRRGAEPRYVEDIAVGEALPALLRGPLTIADMVAWSAGIGPSYKAGRWGYLDLNKAMHSAMFNPVTGFPVKYSGQHEDVNLAAGRGMPAPFDNGVMRFAWVAPLITNWMGDDGFLKRLNVQVRGPGLYGDLITYTAKVTAKDDASGDVKIDLSGANQNGIVTTAGSACVILSKRRS